jgi:hypothetical protein
MVMAPRRYFIRFEKSDGSEAAIWKTNRYEYEQRQTLQLANMPLVGESYSFDNQGPEPSIKGNGSEAVRFLNLGDEDDIDIDIDNFKRIVDWGVGKIVTRGADGTERWAWGRPTDMPNLSFQVDQVYHQPVMVTFDRSSNFYATAHDDLFNVSDPQTVVVTNGGNADALDVIVIFKGPATANVSLINSTALLPGTTTPYKIESTRVLAASTDWLKFDGRRNEVMRSANSGATWVDDAGNAVLQSGQLRMMLLKPGDNSLVVDNVSGDIEVIFTETWH